MVEFYFIFFISKNNIGSRFPDFQNLILIFLMTNSKLKEKKSNRTIGLLCFRHHCSKIREKLHSRSHVFIDIYFPFFLEYS